MELLHKEGAMSYYKLRSFHLDKEGNPVMSVADSSTYPVTYFKTQIDGERDPLANLERFCVDLLNGNIQPDNTKAMNEGPTRPGSVLRAMEKLIKENAPAVNFDRDLELRLNCTKDLYSLVAREYGVWLLQGKAFDLEKVKQDIAEFNEKTKELYKSTEKALKDKGVVTVRAASMSDVFPGFDILFNANADECIIAKQENYDNGGMLDNSDGKALFLGNTSGRLFHALTSGGPGLSRERIISIKEALEKAYPGERIPVKVEPDFMNDIISGHGPKGLFFCEEHNRQCNLTTRHVEEGPAWIACDNRKGIPFTEDFADRRDAISCLYGEIIDNIRMSTFEIYQLKETAELRDYLYAPLKSLKKEGKFVRGDNYEKLYEAKFTQGDLDRIYEEFNVNKPNDYYGHSLSVSDVIVLHDKGEDAAYYVDTFGFTKLDNFRPDGPGVLMQEIGYSLRRECDGNEEALNAPVTVRLSSGESYKTSTKEVIEACRKYKNRAYYERDPKVKIGMGKDFLGREYSPREQKFSEIACIKSDKGYVYETAPYRNMRRLEEMQKGQEQGMGRV